MGIKRGTPIIGTNQAEPANEGTRVSILAEPHFTCDTKAFLGTSFYWINAKTGEKIEPIPWLQAEMGDLADLDDITSAIIDMGIIVQIDLREDIA